MPETALAELIPLHHVRESKANSRQHFDKAKLDELVLSVAQVGVLEPIMVRAVQAGGYEVVFGARRLRAAQAAKLTHVPAMVRELSDLQALEMQLVENGRRQDVHPLEEADGYRRLHEDHKRTVDQVAKTVGKSPTYVYGRMRLCSLEPLARQAFLDGRLDAAAALAVARLPKYQQERATKEVVQCLVSGAVGQGGVPALVRDRFMLALADAPFDTHDAKLLDVAGACADCPKNTAQQRQLFGDAGKDALCTDPECYANKRELAWKATAERAAKAGQEVLETDPAKLFPYGRLAHDSGYVDLAEVDYAHPKERTYGEQVGKKVTPIVARDAAGRVHQLVRREDAAKLVKGLAEKKPEPHAAETEEDAAKRALADNQQVAESLIAETVKKAAGMQYWTSAQWLAVIGAAGFFEGDRAKEVAKRNGWAEKGRPAGAVVREWAEKMDARGHACLLLEAALSGQVSKWGGIGAAVTEVAKAFQVDVKAVRVAALKARKEARS